MRRNSRNSHANARKNNKKRRLIYARERERERGVKIPEVSTRRVMDCSLNATVIFTQPDAWRIFHSSYIFITSYTKKIPSLATSRESQNILQLDDEKLLAFISMTGPHEMAGERRIFKIHFFGKNTEKKSSTAIAAVAKNPLCLMLE
jgi:hypothetical protein